MKNILRVILSFTVVFAAVALASLFISPGTSSWYASLIKPAFAPPTTLFALIWIFLYVLLAIALARVWICKESGTWRMWFFVFATQLLLSVLWAMLFFGLHSVTLSSAETIVLWFAVVIVTLDTYEIDRVSFWLLVPYLAWITFVMIFDLTLWWMN